MKTWLEVCRQALLDSRRSLIWWSLGLLLYTLLVMSFFPSIKSDPSINEGLKDLPETMRALIGDDITTPVGYINGRLYSLMPVILSVFAGLTGAGLIAGAEKRGYLEFPLSQPISRRTLLIGRMLALLVMLLGLGVVLVFSTWLCGRLFQAFVPLDRVVQTVLFHVLAAWVFGAISLAVGAVWARPALAAAIGGGVGIGALVLHSLISNIRRLNFLDALIPWKYALADYPLKNEVSFIPLVVFLVLGIAAALTAIPFYEKRDVR